jgi:hypothetical protein
MGEKTHARTQSAFCFWGRRTFSFLPALNVKAQSGPGPCQGIICQPAICQRHHHYISQVIIILFPGFFLGGYFLYFLLFTYKLRGRKEELAKRNKRSAKACCCWRCRWWISLLTRLLLEISPPQKMRTPKCVANFLLWEDRCDREDTTTFALSLSVFNRP